MTNVSKNAKSCPACGAPVEPQYRPFCSRRCADLDLWRWLGGAYRVQSSEPVGTNEIGDGED